MKRVSSGTIVPRLCKINDKFLEFNICCRTQNLFYMAKNTEYLGFGQMLNTNNKKYYHFYKIKEKL